MKYLLAFLSFVLPTLIIGFVYKYGYFKEEYSELSMYREDISMSLAFASLFVQAIFWTIVASKILKPGAYWKNTIRLFALMFPLGLSFNVCVIGAKHVMTSVSDFMWLETGFTLLMYLVVCPLITWSLYAKP